MVSRLVVGLLFLAGSISAQGQSTVWSDAWDAAGQPGLSWDGTTMVRTTTGQLVFLGDIYGWGYQVTSMTPAGVVNWQINLADFFDGSQLIAGADGSVFIGTPSATTKIDSSGHVVWYRNDLGALAYALSADELYVANCNGVAGLDLDTGATQWSVPRSSANHCKVGLATDAAGSGYLISQVTDPPYAPVPPVRLAKFDAGGSPSWDISIPVTGIGAKLLGAANGRVYVNQGPDVAAYNASSGALYWTHAQMTGLFLAGAPASPIARDNGGMHKLDAADGHTDWTQPSSTDFETTTVQGDDIYICSTVRTVSKMNAATGIGDWSFNLVTSPGPCFALAIDAGNVLAASIDASSGAIHIDTIDTASGNAVATALAGDTQQGIVEVDAFTDRGRIVQAGKVLSTTDYRLRSIDASTGSVDWDVAFEPPLSGWGPLLGRSADSIIVTDYSANSALYGSDYWIGSFARSDGSLRWAITETAYAAPSGIATAWGSAPLTDSHGDVFVAYSQSGGCPFNIYTYCFTSTLMKLAAADGSVLWHFDSMNDYDAFDAGEYGEAPPFTLIGDDVLVAGNFTDALAGKNIVRLSGSDGSVTWSAAPFTSESSTTVKVNPDGTITLTSLQSRALLQSSGNVLWTDHPTVPCSTCVTYVSAQLADGTMLYPGTDFYTSYSNAGWVIAQPLVQDAPARKVFIETDAPPDVRRWPTQIVVDGAATWIVGYMKQPPRTFFYFLGKLDPATLTISDQQVLASSEADVFAPGSGFDMLAAPSNDLLPADTYVWGGGAPVGSGAALFDTAIAARGDLALTVTGDTDTAAFHAAVTYSGDTPVTGARVMLWHKGYYDTDSLACVTVSATNCIASSHSGYVEATFDIQPGGSVTLSGSYPGPLGTLYGSVVGPGTLAEPTLGNNFATFPNDVVFRNGFE